jgi:hypothetical protein
MCWCQLQAQVDTLRVGRFGVRSCCIVVRGVHSTVIVDISGGPWVGQLSDHVPTRHFRAERKAARLFSPSPRSPPFPPYHPAARRAGLHVSQS